MMTVSQFATELKMPAPALLEQLAKAGVSSGHGEGQLSSSHEVIEDRQPVVVVEMAVDDHDADQRNTGHRLGDHERPGAEPERFGGPPGHVSHQRAEPDGFSHVEQAPTTGPTGSGDEPWVGTAAWIGGHHERGGCERIERARFVHGSPVDAGRGRPATPRPGNETCVTPMLPLGRWVLSTGW